MALLAVVPAAGIGNRMQSSLPKQYLPLHGRAVLAHSLGRLAALPELKTVMVAVAPADPWWAQVQAELNDPRIESCVGGSDRWQSVLNALDALAQSASDNDWVLVHDAVRPCVRVGDIERLLTTVESTGATGGLLAIPVSDTIKRASVESRVEMAVGTFVESTAVESTAGWPHVASTVDRQHLWAACTSQVFRLGALRDCLRRAAAADIALTDEASAMEW